MFWESSLMYDGASSHLLTCVRGSGSDVRDKHRGRPLPAPHSPVMLQRCFTVPLLAAPRIWPQDSLQSRSTESLYNTKPADTPVYTVAVTLDEHVQRCLARSLSLFFFFPSKTQTSCWIVLGEIFDIFCFHT